MELKHHELTVQFSDDWWAEAGMIGFKPSSAAYRSDPGAFPARQIFEVRIDEIGPVQRAPNVGIFNDSPKATARERVVAILQGFRSGAAIPPVEVVEAASSGAHPYKLVHGSHRLYCSLAAGFTHVPAVEGFDQGTALG